MAFSGIHVEFGSAGALPPIGGDGDTESSMPVARKPSYSQNLTATATASSVSAIAGKGNADPIVTVKAKLDSFVSIGNPPDAVAGTVILVFAGTTEQRTCDPGDKVAYILVP